MSVDGLSLPEAELYAAWCRTEAARWQEALEDAEARVTLLKLCEDIERVGMLRTAKKHFGEGVTER